ncbi:hypothetical protein SNEBB_004955 [Seison nebaliae]|nr:hypothetical protein SNEBB_004955 [Seison nebaliae]
MRSLIQMSTSPYMGRIIIGFFLNLIAVTVGIAVNWVLFYATAYRMPFITMTAKMVILFFYLILGTIAFTRFVYFRVLLFIFTINFTSRTIVRLLRNTVVSVLALGVFHNIVVNFSEISKVISCSTEMLSNLSTVETNFQTAHLEHIARILPTLDQKLNKMMEDINYEVMLPMRNIDELLKKEEERAKNVIDQDTRNFVNGKVPSRSLRKTKVRKATSLQFSLIEKLKQSLIAKCEALIRKSQVACQAKSAKVFLGRAIGLVGCPYAEDYLKLKYVREDCIKQVTGISTKLAHSTVDIRDVQRMEAYKNLKDNSQNIQIKFKEFNMTMLSNLIGLNNLTMLKNKFNGIMNKAEPLFSLARTMLKVSTYVIIFIGVWNSVNYVRLYQKNIESDNHYLAKRFKQIDDVRGRKLLRTVLPVPQDLQKDNELINPRSFQQSPVESSMMKKNIMYDSFLLITFMSSYVFALMVCEILEAWRRHSEMNVDIIGINQNDVIVDGKGPLAEAVAEFLASFEYRFHLNETYRNHDCLPQPVRLKRHVVYYTLGMLAINFIMSTIGPYMMRVRRIIMYSNFPEREKRRTYYIYNKLLREKRVSGTERINSLYNIVSYPHLYQEYIIRKYFINRNSTKQLISNGRSCILQKIKLANDHGRINSKTVNSFSKFYAWLCKFQLNRKRVILVESGLSLNTATVVKAASNESLNTLEEKDVEILRISEDESEPSDPSLVHTLAKVRMSSNIDKIIDDLSNEALNDQINSQTNLKAKKKKLDEKRHPNTDLPSALKKSENKSNNNRVSLPFTRNKFKIGQSKSGILKRSKKKKDVRIMSEHLFNSSCHNQQITKETTTDFEEFLRNILGPNKQKYYLLRENDNENNFSYKSNSLKSLKSSFTVNIKQVQSLHKIHQNLVDTNSEYITFNNHISDVTPVWMKTEKLEYWFIQRAFNYCVICEEQILTNELYDKIVKNAANIHKFMVKNLVFFNNEKDFMQSLIRELGDNLLNYEKLDVDPEDSKDVDMDFGHERIYEFQLKKKPTFLIICEHCHLPYCMECFIFDAQYQCPHCIWLGEIVEK